MSPLSAIRAYATPGLAPLQQAGQAGAASTIPAHELKGLDSAPSLISSSPPGVTETPFSSMFGRLVNEVNEKQAAASEAVKGLLSGQNIPLHQAVIAMEEANVSFQLMVEVRNKVLEAYQELMRMQI